MKRIFLSLTILIFVNCAFAQSYLPKRPNWAYNTPEAEDYTYEYYVSKGVGNTEKEARTDAFVIAVKEAQSRVGLGANSTEIINAFQSGEKFNVVAGHYEIPMKEVCNFSVKNGDQWYYYQLLQVAISGNIIPQFKHFAGDCYDFSKADEYFNAGVNELNQGKNKRKKGWYEYLMPKQIQINYQVYEVLPMDLDDTYSWKDAKSACRSLTAFGKRDWRLPTKEELNGMYLKKEDIGGFKEQYYWSSTLYPGSHSSVWCSKFSTGSQSSYGKSGVRHYVRCIRKK